MIIPYGWAKESDGWPEHGHELEKTVRNAAETIGCPVIGTNLVGSIAHGPWKGQIFGGQSVVCDEKGKVLAKAKDREREVLMVEVEC